MYDRDRYFTVTGNVFEGRSEIRENAVVVRGRTGRGSSRMPARNSPRSRPPRVTTISGAAAVMGTAA